MNTNTNFNVEKTIHGFQSRIRALSKESGLVMSEDSINIYSRIALAIMDYATNAKRSEDITKDTLIVFTKLLDTLFIYNEDKDYLIIIELTLLQYLVSIATARYMVDSVNNELDSKFETGLTVNQLSVLSGLKEQSIRNRMVKGPTGCPKVPDGLITTVFNGKTLVSPETAVKWLKTKSRYVKTTYI
jgi:hypothetical protein